MFNYVVVINKVKKTIKLYNTLKIHKSPNKSKRFRKTTKKLMTTLATYNGQISCKVCVA